MQSKENEHFRVPAGVPLCDETEERAKARQASKLVQIREALVSAGCDTTAKQAVALG